MAFPRAAICIFWLCAMVEAAQLRSRAPPSVPVKSESPAEAEDAEDNLDTDEEQSGGDQPALAQIFNQAPLAAALPQQVPQQVSQPQQVPQQVPQPQQVPVAVPTMPELAMPAMPKFAVPQEEVQAASTWAAPAVAPSAPVAAPEAVFQFSPPRTSMVLPPVAAPKAAVAEGSRVASKPKLPSWLQSNASSEDSMPKNWPPSGDKYRVCDPPCITGRGFCNDNVCFCRSPYAGATCQHKTTDLYRAPKIMVVGFAATCFVMGIVLSKIIFSFSEHAIETRLERYGKGRRRFELWTPPQDQSKQKKEPPKKKADTGM